MSRASRREALQLLALSSFALAQPLFAVLGRYPGFFAAHHVGPRGVVLFALALVVVPWLVVILVARLLGVRSLRRRRIVHVVLVAALVALVALPYCSALPAAVAYSVAAVIGAAFAALYVRRPRVREFTTTLALAAPLFLVVFVCLSPVSNLVFGGAGDAWATHESYRPPVVFLQLDAFPALLAQTPDHRIDAVRFPNLARLSREGVWYRNASNTHENTVFSIPSILSGRYSHHGLTPVAQDWNPNLFTMLGPGYSMNVTEEATSLCPPGYCHKRARVHQNRLTVLFDDTRVVFNHIIRPDDQRRGLPTTRRSWSQFVHPPNPVRLVSHKKTAAHIIRHLRSGRIRRFGAWLARVGQSGDLPELDFIHMFLPHERREFLPDGHSYQTPSTDLEQPPAYNSAFLTEQEEQRTILQIGFTDRIVGRVIARLERLGIYDRALIVVVADHGESFDTAPRPVGPFVPGHLGYRRAATLRNLEDIASPPLFIKYPKGHGPTGIDDRFVRTIDIFPTIAQVTHHVLTAPVDGRSLLDPLYRGHGSIQEGRTFGSTLRMSTQRWTQRREASLRRRLRLFGWGRASVYRFGPRPGLVGRRASAMRLLPALPGVRATVHQLHALGHVDPLSRVCLCQLAGRMTGKAAGVPIAVAVNGVIQATGLGFAPRGGFNWAVMVPPGAYRRGRNVVQVFRIEGNALRPLGRAP